MADGQALNTLFRLVRDFSIQTPVWGEAVRYFTKPDERWDLTRVSAMVYGNRDNALVIQAAAGLDSPELELTERLLILPTATQLRQLKLQAGFDASDT